MNKIPKWVFYEFGGILKHLFWLEGVDFFSRIPESRWIISQTKIKPREKLLDLACGNGQHAICFAKADLVVTGVDCCGGLIKDARKEASKKNLNISFYKSDMRTFKNNNLYNVVTLLNMSSFL